MSKERLHKYIKSLGGYKISGAHFKIGAKVHSEDFYHAKGLFQNSYYATRMAIYLAGKIMPFIKEGYKSLTLVGYEMYSELLLSLISKLLKEADINHCLAIDMEEDIRYLPESANDSGFFKQNIVIIVPITSTGSTMERIKSNVREVIKKGEEKKEIFKTYTVLQVFDPELITELRGLLEEGVDDEAIIKLPTKWQHPFECNWCFPRRKNDERRPLFEIAKSSLSPSVIFELPSAKSVKEPTVNFDSVNFKEALTYRSKSKTNKHFLFSTAADTLIQKNKGQVKEWLKAVKATLKIHPYDKVVIISPCQETNTSFINLVNQELFHFSATIIHHRPEVDYFSNFRIFNQTYLKHVHTKVFYVDDNLVSGESFFKIYDLYQHTSQYKKGLSGAIFLCDKSSPDIHTHVSQTVDDGHFYAFVNINLPSHPTVFGKSQLEQEIKRYERVAELALHDSPRKHFTDRAKQLDPERKLDSYGVGKDDEIKIERYLRRFKIVHKTYDFFQKVKESSGTWEMEELLETCMQESHEFNKSEMEISIMKVLSQNPFSLYKEIREKSFEWLDIQLKDTIEHIHRKTTGLDLRDVEKFKFLMKRAVFFGNLRIANTQTFRTIKIIFQEWKPEEIEVENLVFFLLNQYIELVEKNGVCAGKIIESIGKVERGTQSVHALKLFRMLKIEAASVVKVFYEHLEESVNMRDYEDWRDLFIDTENELNTKSIFNERAVSNINEVFKSRLFNELTKVNKYKVAHNAVKLYKDDIPTKHSDLEPAVLNYLWIKRFLQLDRANKARNENTKLKEKTANVFGKLKGLFSKKVNAFFIVVDGKREYHVDYNDDRTPLVIDKESKDAVSEFLNEKTKLGRRTIIEYKKEGQNWQNIYDIKLRGRRRDEEDIRKSDVGDDEDLLRANWMLLIRITAPDMESTDSLRTLGIMGFYSKNDLSTELLPRQLLMLLRDDLKVYIQQHYENEAFAELRIAEAIERFAYLAGHGRQMMQELARDATEVCREDFQKIVRTMEHLQFLIATRMLSDKGNTSDTYEKSRKDLLNRYFFLKEIPIKEVAEKMKEIADAIYTSKLIENDVEVNSDIEVEHSGKFNFNEDILKFICFELLVNAKKNRFHFINQTTGKNTLKITFKVNNSSLCLSVMGTGPEVDSEDVDKINTGYVEQIKKEYELSGLRLINKVIKLFDKGNMIKIKVEESETDKKSPGMFRNTVTVTLMSIEKDDENPDYREPIYSI